MLSLSLLLLKYQRNKESRDFRESKVLFNFEAKITGLVTVCMNRLQCIYINLSPCVTQQVVLSFQHHS
jgi:hypothetical protein